MNGVDKDPRHELYSDVPGSADHLAYCKKYWYVLFSGTAMLFPASLAALSLTLGCVCACSCVGRSISSALLKFVSGGGHGSATALSSILETVSVLLCNETLGISSFLSVEGEAV